MTDLNNSVIMPREDFIELSTVAFDNSHVPTAGERIGSVVQATMVMGAFAGAVTAIAWGCGKAADWYENRKHERLIAELQFKNDINLNK
jgi:hypothetical protein